MTRKIKPVIFAFWEGESEQAYIRFLKKHFDNAAIIKPHGSAGLFETAVNAFQHNPRYLNYINATDEIWFLFDTELEKGAGWVTAFKAIKRLRRLRQTEIRIRLLMTTACFEYWLLLHYERCAPLIATPADKERIMARIKEYVPLYKKGDQATTEEIAANYPIAVKNGEWTLLRLIDDNLPELDDTDKRNGWLFKGKRTFTTVHEAIQYLTGL